MENWQWTMIALDVIIVFGILAVLEALNCIHRALKGIQPS
jgi:hypothetical protein